MQNDKNTHFDWIIMGGIGVFLSLVPCLFNPHFYFIDDAQQEFMPAFYNIGRALRAGSFPFITLTNWFGGNYLAEYQYALYNPVSLLTYLALPSINSLAVAATVLACFYQGILAGGAVVLARSFGIARSATWLVAVTIVTNNFIDYWFAAAWPPLLVATAWFVWAWAFLMRAHESPGKWLSSVFFSYLMLSSGSPHTDIVFGILCLILLTVSLWRRAFFQTFAVGAAFTVSILLTMPSFIPVLSVYDLMGRAHSVFNQSFLVPNLFDVLGLSSPFLQDYMDIYYFPTDSMVPHGGLLPLYSAFRRMSTPFLYCAWYIFPLLPLISWRRIEFGKPAIVILAALAAVLLVGTQGPDHFAVLMAPFRFIPYFHMAAVLLFFSILTQKKIQTSFEWRSARWSLVLLVLAGVMELQKHPSDYAFIAAGVALCVAGFVFFLYAGDHGEPIMFYSLSLTTVLLFVITHIYYPANTDLVDWHMNPDKGRTPLKNRTVDSYTFYDGGAGDPNSPDRLREFQTGYMSLEAGVAQVNGYSSIIHRPLAALLCLTVFGETCPESASRLFAHDPLTGAPLIDLFQINRIVAMKGPHLDALLPYMKKDWHLESDGQVTQTFVRALPNADLPGMVGWIPSGTDITPVGRQRPLREKYQLADRPQQNDHIVFSRLWWPGYEAEFAGREVPVHAEQGVFVTVDLPDDAPRDGTLLLTYMPPHWRISIALFMAGAALCLGMTLFWNHFSGWVPARSLWFSRLTRLRRKTKPLEA